MNQDSSPATDAVHSVRYDDVSERSQLYTWGQNEYGELALGDSPDRNQPCAVNIGQKDIQRILQVAAGNELTIVLTSKYEVFCCGYNDSGQCGVLSMNRVPELTRVDCLSSRNIRSIHCSNGSESVMAVSDQGKVYAWGCNARGQLGLGNNANVSRPVRIENLVNHRVVKIACSYYHTVLVTDEDLAFSMGRNDVGQLGIGHTNDLNLPERITELPASHILDVACGQYHTAFAVDGVGVLTCGKNEHFQLGITRHNDPVWVPQPTDPFSFSNGGMPSIVALSCGYYHTVAVAGNGSVYAWGRNDYGQCGTGAWDSVKNPQFLDKLPENGIVAVSCGCYHSLFLSDEGRLYSCGRGNHGQLGIWNSRGDLNVPTRLESISNSKVRSVVAGFYHSMCLTGEAESPFEKVASTLKHDLRSLINNPSRSDVIFIVEGQPIYAHRCIVMTRCEPLEIMLEGSMKEAFEKEVELKDIRYHLVLALLEFLYTDEVQSLSSNSFDLNFALDLLAVADQFLVEGLKRQCEIAIQKSMSVENVAFMFKNADQRQASSLRKRCFDYIIRYFGKVIGTDGFIGLPSHLLKEVLFAAHEKGVSIRP